MIGIHVFVSWGMNFHWSCMFPNNDVVALGEIGECDRRFWGCSSFDISVFSNFSQLFGYYGGGSTGSGMWPCITFLLNVSQWFGIVSLVLLVRFILEN